MCYTAPRVPPSGSGSPPARTQGHSLPFTNGDGAWRAESPVHSGSADGGHLGWNLDALGLTPGVRPPCPLPPPHRIRASLTPPGLQALEKAWGGLGDSLPWTVNRSPGAWCCHQRGPGDPVTLLTQWSSPHMGQCEGGCSPRAYARLNICVPSTQTHCPCLASNYAQSPVTDQLGDGF